jgi:hypothetical protein
MMRRLLLGVQKMTTVTLHPHPKSDKVVFVKSSARFKSLDGSPAPSGLLKLLERNFYPDYDKRIATSGPSEARSTAAGDVATVRGGLRTGTWTDESIGKSVDLMRKYRFPMEAFWVNADYLKARHHPRLLATHLKELEKIYRAQVAVGQKKFKPYVRDFWITLTKLKLRVVGYQVEVRHATCPISTNADIIAIDDKGKYHVIELKTGYETYYYKHTVFPMKYPFSDQNDSCYNQQQLQLAATHCMYKQHYPAHQIGDPVLLQFKAGGTQIHTLQAWAADRVNEMFGAIRYVKKKELTSLPAGVALRPPSSSSKKKKKTKRKSDQSLQQPVKKKKRKTSVAAVVAKVEKKSRKKPSRPA